MPSTWRGQFGGLLLLGLAGAAAAADGLPPLRVDPALLGAPPVPRRPVVQAPAAATPVAVIAAPPAAPVVLDAPQRIELAPAAVLRGEPARSAPPAAAKAEPVVAATLSGTPPEVAERPQLAATYSAHVAAGQLPALSLKTSSTLTSLGRDDGEARPTFFSADRVSGHNDVEMVAEGAVEMRRLGVTFEADRLTYTHATDEVDAVGNVRLTRDQDVITGPHLRMRVEENLGFFDQPNYTVKRMSKTGNPLVRQPVTAYGEASRIEFEGEEVYRLRSGTYSTCAPTDRDWYIGLDDLLLDYSRETGEASDVKVVFKDTPIFYFPWLSFSLNNQRKSGFLSPTIGSTSLSGMEVIAPWYWNIAPNMDATLSPRYMTRRGLQVNGEFRYLDYDKNGQLRAEYLPNDNLLGKRRSAYSLVHNQNFGGGLYGSLNLNGASDDTYFSDMSSRLSVVTQTNLLRQGTLFYGGGWWSANLLAQSYQTLQDPNAPPVAIPYRRLPQLTVTALRPDLPMGLTFGFGGEYVSFHHPTSVLGKRTVFYPQLSLPIQTAAFSVTPKIGVHATRYQLERLPSDAPEQVTRQLPIVSLDSSMVFERDVSWQGRAMTQTLEPRLYYLYVPRRDQAGIPVFDTALADFNFAQIFAENRYGGGDRIADANQLTAALISRLIDPTSGAELMRGMIGQRFYFTTQHVTLPGEVARADRKTDLLAAFSGYLLPKTYFDAGWQYNPSRSRTERLNLGGRYQPETGKVLNAGYRYTRDQLGQVDLSAQWPLSGGWHGVGRFNYSTKERRVVESVAGLEYDGGCWTARLVLQRLAVQSDKASSALFVQLELNGLTRIGSNPLDILKRNIPGYGVINQPTADPVFAAN